jgi:prophage regulatory protein
MTTKFEGRPLVIDIKLQARAIRREELRQIVPLSDTTIYEMEMRGEFPRRYNLTNRCVAWDLAEVEAWLEERRRASAAGQASKTHAPDVRRRLTRPVKAPNR